MTVSNIVSDVFSHFGPEKDTSNKFEGVLAASVSCCRDVVVVLEDELFEGDIVGVVDGVVVVKPTTLIGPFNEQDFFGLFYFVF